MPDGDASWVHESDWRGPPNLPTSSAAAAKPQAFDLLHGPLQRGTRCRPGKLENATSALLTLVALLLRRQQSNVLVLRATSDGASSGTS